MHDILSQTFEPLLTKTYSF